jgi:Flp pilus assembly protein TadD, contains TPR repeats
MTHFHFRSFARLSAILLLASLPSGTIGADSAKEQMQFGVKAAKDGLWREAIFRWEKALKLDPNNARLKNNLAVAYETTGNFEKAEALYQQAVRADPGNRDIKQNFDLFMSYYKQMRSRQEKEPSPPAPAPADNPPPPADDATPR